MPARSSVDNAKLVQVEGRAGPIGSGPGKRLRRFSTLRASR